MAPATENSEVVRTKMAKTGIDIEEIEKLVRLVEERGLTELVFEGPDRAVVIRAAGEVVTTARPRPVPSGISSAPHAHDSERIACVSPAIGVFYTTAGPDQPPFVEVGDHVEHGQTVGLLEAMKVFSEIPSEVSGTVLEMVAKSGQLVRPGEPLLYLRPDA